MKKYINFKKKMNKNNIYGTWLFNFVCVLNYVFFLYNRINSAIISTYSSLHKKKLTKYKQ